MSRVLSEALGHSTETAVCDDLQNRAQAAVDADSSRLARDDAAHFRGQGGVPGHPNDDWAREDGACWEQFEFDGMRAVTAAGLDREK